MLQISRNIVNHTLSMGCMKSVTEHVGVKISTNAVSVYSLPKNRGVCVGYNACLHACATEHAFFYTVEYVHVIALCTLHVAFLGYPTINEDKCIILPNTCCLQYPAPNCELQSQMFPLA